MAQKHKWSEKMTHDVCARMDRFMDLYRGRKLKAFFEAIVQATPGKVAPLLSLFPPDMVADNVACLPLCRRETYRDFLQRASDSEDV